MTFALALRRICKSFGSSEISESSIPASRLNDAAGLNHDAFDAPRGAMLLLVVTNAAGALLNRSRDRRLTISSMYVSPSGIALYPAESGWT